MVILIIQMVVIVMQIVISMNNFEGLMSVDKIESNYSNAIHSIWMY